ncbi:MAG: hypothetical protein IPM82_05960 [Saprospiraceae bacterium]|nr:hypothetical protein [Saprospiraceae bacterium]
MGTALEGTTKTKRGPDKKAGFFKTIVFGKRGAGRRKGERARGHDSLVAGVGLLALVCFDIGTGKPVRSALALSLFGFQHFPFGKSFQYMKLTEKRPSLPVLPWESENPSPSIWP